MIKIVFWMCEGQWSRSRRSLRFPFKPECTLIKPPPPSLPTFICAVQKPISLGNWPWNSMANGWEGVDEEWIPAWIEHVANGSTPLHTSKRLSTASSSGSSSTWTGNHPEKKNIPSLIRRYVSSFSPFVCSHADLFAICSIHNFFHFKILNMDPSEDGRQLEQVLLSLYDKCYKYITVTTCLVGRQCLPASYYFQCRIEWLPDSDSGGWHARI